LVTELNRGSTYDSEYLSDYDKLDTWESEVGFKSLRKHFIDSNYPPNFEPDESELPVPDAILSSLLNPDKIIQITPWIFKFIPVTESVYALHIDNKNLLPVLISEEDFNDYPEISKFTYEDEIFSILDDIHGEGNAIFGCGEKGVDKRETGTGEIEYCSEDGDAFTYEFTIKYEKFGIDKSLWTEIKHRDDRAWNQEDDITRYDLYYEGHYKPKCRDLQEILYEWNVFNGSVTTCPLNYPAMERKGRTKKINLYKSSRGLSAFYVDSGARIRSGCLPKEDFDNGVWICVPSIEVISTGVWTLNRP